MITTSNNNKTENVSMHVACMCVAQTRNEEAPGHQQHFIQISKVNFSALLHCAMATPNEIFAQLVKKQPVVKANEKVENVDTKKTLEPDVNEKESKNHDTSDDKTLADDKNADKDATLAADGISKIVAKQIASQFPLLSNDPNVHAVDSATNVFAAAGSGKYIYWNKKVNYYRSQRLRSTKDYDKMIPRGQETPFTWPMLLSAAEIGDEFNVKTLLGKSIVLPPEVKTLNASIVRAAREGHLHTVRLLLSYGRGASPNAIDLLDERAKYSNRKYVALHEAAKAGHDNVLSCLLDRGADPHLRGAFNRSILHMAAEGGYDKCVAIALGWILADGWEHELNAVDEMGNQAIHMASKEGHDNVIETLLRKRANVNATTNDKSTPLLLATKQGHLKAVKTLLAHHANPYLPDKNGETPFQWALFKKRKQIIDLLLPAQVTFAASTDTSAVSTMMPLQHKNLSGETVLITSVKNGFQEVAKKLIDAGANIDAQTNNGDTALHWAARKGQYKMSAMLLDNGASLSILNKYNMTPFEIASENSSSFEFVMLFLKGGEDGEDSGHEFQRRSEKALLCACEYGRLVTAQQLIDRIRVNRQCRDKNENSCLHGSPKWPRRYY